MFPTEPAEPSGRQQNRGEHARVCREFVTRKKTRNNQNNTSFFFFCPGNVMGLEATALFCKLSPL